MKTDYYKIDNSVERIINNKSTLFLDQKELKTVKSKLKKHLYKEYYPYKDSEKVILYTNILPSVSLFKIYSYEKLRHQDILGSIMALNISSSYLGDIIIDNDLYYFYILSELKDFISNNFISVGKNRISLEEVNLDELVNYERNYEKNEIIVSSSRIDNVLSKIIGCNRETILKKIKDKEIILNYEVLTKASYVLKENDIFSIRKYGKYKYIGISKHTKKDNLIIEYLKYL